MQVDELLPFLRENQETLIQEIRGGNYKPNPVRRVEIPKETKGCLLYTSPYGNHKDITHQCSFLADPAVRCCSAAPALLSKKNQMVGWCGAVSYTHLDVYKRQG